MTVAVHGYDKVGLVGAGMVGSSFAYCLIQSDLADELVLVDADHDRAEGEAMDLNHGLPFVSPMRIHAGGYADLGGCGLVVVTAGANQRPGQSRLDLLRQNAAVMRDVIPQVVAACPDAIILVATNPVDLLTQISADLADLPPGRVFGSGTLLDTARFRFLLGRHYAVDPRSIHALIIGEHGDGKIPVWSLAQIAGIPLPDFVGPRGKGHDRAALDRIFEETRHAAYDIIQKKRATYYAIGLALMAIVRAVLRDQRTVLTVTAPLRGCYGLDGMSSSLPRVVGRDGAAHTLELPMSGEELTAFRESTGRLRSLLADLD